MASGHHNIIMANMNGSSYAIIYMEKIIPFVPGLTSKYLLNIIVGTLFIIIVHKHY